MKRPPRRRPEELPDKSSELLLLFWLWRRDLQRAKAVQKFAEVLETEAQRAALAALLGPITTAMRDLEDQIVKRRARTAEEWKSQATIISVVVKRMERGDK